jgi:release factor glutamine methyltransferase
MSSSLSARSDLVGRLRAAGCVFAEDEAELLVTAARDTTELTALTERRVAGEPLEHILGWAEFCGLRVTVRPGVFVPRRRTELLVRQAAALIRPGAVVVDLCCGSGAVAAALASTLAGTLVDPVGRLELHAADLDPVAVRCAEANLASVGGHAYRGDLYRALPDTLRGKIEVLTANAPYVPTGSVALMPPEARDHEPRIALDGGPDGLAVLRQVIAEAPRWLAPGGHLLFETGAGQATAAAASVAAVGLAPRVVSDSELGATVIIGTRTPHA